MWIVPYHYSTFFLLIKSYLVYFQEEENIDETIQEVNIMLGIKPKRSGKMNEFYKCILAWIYTVILLAQGDWFS